MSVETYLGPAHQEFDQELRKWSCYSEVSASEFVLVSRLGEWLLQDSKSNNSTETRTWLEEIIRESDPKFELSSIWANKFDNLKQKIERRENSCLRVVCILIALRLCHFVFDLNKNGLDDGKLPLETDSYFRRIKTLSNPEIQARRFQAEQWKYCAQQITPDDEHDFQPQQVIPITRKRPINQWKDFPDDESDIRPDVEDSSAAPAQKGGVGAVSEIRIPDDYVDPEIQKYVKSNGPRNVIKGENGILYYRFAMKEVPLKEDFDREMKSFRLFNLKSPSPGIVTYFHNYSQNKSDLVDEKASSNCIILEYCDGDLGDWLKTQPPPLFGPDLHTFWYGLFQVAQGLDHLHMMEDQNRRRWYGWHFDIKPDNILRVGNKWKLGDPGYAQFRSEEELRKVLSKKELKDGTDEIPEATDEKKTKWQQGTRTCGAPETHMNQDDKLVTQSVDIWSLGCIFSLAATWVVLGDEGVDAFAKLRRDAIERYQNVRPGKRVLEQGDQFHDPEQVLPVVEEWHQLLRETARTFDSLTAKILDLVDGHMLLKDPHLRITAPKLFEKLKDMKASTPLPETKVPEDLRKKIDLGRSRIGVHQTPPLKKSPTKKPPTEPETDTERDNQRTIDPSGSNYEHKKPTQLDPVLGTLPRERLELSDEDEKALRSKRVYHILEELKPKKKTPPGPTNRLLELVSGRNFSILVDNSATMWEHWEKVTTLVEAIELKLRKSGNTVSLDFSLPLTKSRDAKRQVNFWRKKIKSRTTDRSSGFATIVKENKPCDTDSSSDFEKVAEKLRECFTAYQKQVEETHEKVVRLTIIFLTDGKWIQKMNQKDAVWEAIVECTKALQNKRGKGKGKLNFETRPFSIEFVQFGNSYSATEGFRKYDDEIQKEAECMGEDIVDWEPWDGRFYKIILGSPIPLIDELLVGPLRSATEAPHPNPKSNTRQPQMKRASSG